MKTLSDVRKEFHEKGLISITYLQRKMKMSFTDASRMISKMAKEAKYFDEENGIIVRVYNTLERTMKLT